MDRPAHSLTTTADATFSRRALLGAAALAVIAARFDRGRLALASADPVADLVAGNTAFALDLYAELRQGADGNLVFSPYSVSEALAMAYAGARGETATQMARALGFGLESAALDAAFAELNADLLARSNADADPERDEPARGLRIANALWGERTYPFDPAYGTRLQRSYGAGLQTADFVNAPEAARAQINDWVAEQTNDRIQDIVPPGGVDSTTRLVLANAIWFSGAWYFPFFPESTVDEPFHLVNGDPAMVPFMTQHEHLAYARGAGFQAMELPYKVGASDVSGLTFLVILPDEGGLTAVEQGMSPEILTATLGQLSSTEVILHLPKFTFDNDAQLGAILATLGMADAFDPLLADFTGMVEGTPPEPLYIGEVLHKAFFNIDETGTEAAAATVEIMVGAAPPEATVPPPVEVWVDRPFLFAIRDTHTGTLLFLGRVMDPRS